MRDVVDMRQDTRAAVELLGQCCALRRGVGPASAEGAKGVLTEGGRWISIGPRLRAGQPSAAGPPESRGGQN